MYEVLLGGGCFWGVQEDLRTIPGVIETEVGYAGGSVANPDYRLVCSGTTGHAEVVKVVADEQQLPLKELLHHFFRLHDPTQGMRQGPDHGPQYRSIIICRDPSQQAICDQVIAQLQRDWPRPITTEVRVGDPFFRAEEYHQDYCRRKGR